MTNTDLASLGRNLRRVAPDGALSSSEIRLMALLGTRPSADRESLFRSLWASVSERARLAAFDAFTGHPF